MAKKKTVPARARKPANARRTPPPRAAHPAPTSTDALIAPDKQHEVQQTIDEHPEIDTMDEEDRGEIIDITARRINPGGGEKPWGRKARNNDPNNPNLNTDGMTFLRPDGLFEIYDCISGTDGQSTWDGYGPFAQGENGYWWPPAEVEDSGGGEETGGELEERLVALEAAVAELQAQNSSFESRIAALEQAATQPLRAHGPVDLPIVVESLTRMRAKGDIDVAVSQGEAVPPTPSDDTWDIVDTIMLKRLIERLRGDESAPEAAAAAPSLDGQVLTLQAKATGKFVRADLNQTHAPLAANGDGNQSWDEFVVAVKR